MSDATKSAAPKLLLSSDSYQDSGDGNHSLLDSSIPGQGCMLVTSRGVNLNPDRMNSLTFAAGSDSLKVVLDGSRVRHVGNWLRWT
ncbi:hypothetical protein AMATHDRAFT_4921 [Amanita thiersii Skay4041]|uniref:Uncharacterized protein n=1 Tax=Amanita thiersii Skay4041 TaxID=703135 RepID=A0A2A9NJA8_9AGAR|nr:hypothetical protein AMATHDRAFT_4921 [Amanita thiersii Skay4041]